MDQSRELKRMILGNLVLVQLQAIVVGFLAALVSILMGWVPHGHFDIRHALVLCSSSTATASIASLALGPSDLCSNVLTRSERQFCLGIIMILVVILSHKCQINPDNIATPIAASLGDLTTLAVLAGVGGFLFRIIGMSARLNINSHLHWWSYRYLYLVTGASNDFLSHSDTHMDDDLCSKWIRSRCTPLWMVSAKTICLQSTFISRNLLF